MRAGVLGLALLTAVATPATAAPAAPAPAGRAAAGSGALSPTVEEQRLDRAAPREILRRSGFDDVAPDFARA
ncbi:pyroglutamyl peptidase, partial [Streptomyces sp. SID7958]|nr:pyroglutamyl peptidase [Streptomyces sp. SID7958]